MREYVKFLRLTWTKLGLYLIFSEHIGLAHRLVLADQIIVEKLRKADNRPIIDCVPLFHTNDMLRARVEEDSTSKFWVTAGHKDEFEVRIGFQNNVFKLTFP